MNPFLPVFIKIMSKKYSFCSIIKTYGLHITVTKQNLSNDQLLYIIRVEAMNEFVVRYSRFLDTCTKLLKSDRRRLEFSYLSFWSKLTWIIMK